MSDVSSQSHHAACMQGCLPPPPPLIDNVIVMLEEGGRGVGTRQENPDAWESGSRVGATSE